MLDVNIIYNFEESQVKKSEVVCFLCEGMHGNNTFCQMSFVEHGGVE